MVCFQTCLSAPTGDASNSESDEYLTDTKIDEINSRLKMTPDMNSKSVDDFTEILRKFRKDSSEKDRIDGAVSGNFIFYCN